MSLFVSMFNVSFCVDVGLFLCLQTHNNKHKRRLKKERKNERNIDTNETNNTIEVSDTLNKQHKLK